MTSPVVFSVVIPLVAVLASATSRATGGLSLVVLLPCGVLVATVGVAWIRRPEVWERHAAWKRDVARVAGGARSEWADDGWRVVSGGIAVLFGVALCALGVLGAAGVFG